MTHRMQMKVRYSHHEAGFFRIRLFGFQWKIIDTRKHRAYFSDRYFGYRFGPFVFRVFKAI